MGMFLLGLGMIVNTIAGLWLIGQCRHKLWAVRILFAALYFVFNNWDETKTPFLTGIGGGVLAFLGFVAVGMAAKDEATTPTTQSVSASRDADDAADDREDATYASAAAPASSYQPAAQTSTYTPSYVPTPTSTPAPAPVATTETQPVEEDLWTRKPKLEQVWVDRDTWLFFSEKCKKLPPNGYRIPKTVAVAQGLTEGKCK